MFGVPFAIRCVTTVMAFSSSVMASNVLVVAPSGTTYTDIQAAVNAAVEGDVVLVRPSASRYPAFTIGDKSAFVVPDPSALVAVWGPVVVSWLSVGRVTGLVNLDVRAVSGPNPSVGTPATLIALDSAY